MFYPCEVWLYCQTWKSCFGHVLSYRIMALSACHLFVYVYWVAGRLSNSTHSEVDNAGIILSLSRRLFTYSITHISWHAYMDLKIVYIYRLTVQCIFSGSNLYLWWFFFIDYLNDGSNHVI